MVLKSRQSILILLSVFLFLPGVGLAFQFWSQYDGESVISVEFLQPSLRDAEEAKFFNSALYLTCHLPMSPRVTFIVDIPYVNADVVFDSTVEGAEKQMKGSDIGNIFAGIKFKNQSPRGSFLMGVRFPTFPADSGVTSYIGEFADIDRLEAFSPNKISVLAQVEAMHWFDSIFTFQYSLGATIQSSSKDQNWWFRYALKFGYHRDLFAVGAEISGIYDGTIEPVDLDKGSFSQVGLSIQGKFGRYHPELLWRIPIDNELKSYLKNVIKIGISIII